MEIIQAIFDIIKLLIVAVIVSVGALMLVRLIMNYADMNPFSRTVLFVRRLTDPLVTPVRRALAGFGIGPNIAPLISLLLAILMAWFVVQLAETILNTAAGLLFGAQNGAVVALIGYALYGLLALYSLLIFIRIIFSWGGVGYGNRLMRFLINATDPLLIPLRRMIPPLGMMDITPIVAFIIIWLFQSAILGTLLRDLPTRFVK
jgi:YggT family protein